MTSTDPVATHTTTGAAPTHGDGSFTLTLDPESRESMAASLTAGIGWHEVAEAGEVQVKFV